MIQSHRGNGLFRMSLLASASASAMLVATPVLAQPADQPPRPRPTRMLLRPPPSRHRRPQQRRQRRRRRRQQIPIRSSSPAPAFARPNSPAPTRSPDRPDDCQREGKLSLAETLQSSPIAAGSTQITAGDLVQLRHQRRTGAQTIDLRGLGANRTLVLLNGRRAGPAGTRGGVSSFDLNVLPQAIVKQVDILKTGASSIYGSDAVAGVVNLITKTDFNGFQIDAFGNIPINVLRWQANQLRHHLQSSRALFAGAQYSVSLLWGKTFDRGHVMVALDYFKQNELARGDRKYLECPEAYVFNHNGGGAPT